MVYAEQYRSRHVALRRERQVTRWRTDKKEMLVRGDLAALAGTSQRARIRKGFTWTDWLIRLRQ
jgi:predicted GIY-YIG superfamily endonuclease